MTSGEEDIERARSDHIVLDKAMKNQKNAQHEDLLKVALKVYGYLDNFAGIQEELKAVLVKLGEMKE
jgi:hypothetical protein